MDLDFIKNEIKNFEETKDITYQDDEINTVYQYVRLKKAFLEKEDSEHYEPVLKENPIRIEFVPSKKHAEEQKRQDKYKNIDTTFHNGYLSNALFEDFNILNEERKKVLMKAQEFVESFEKKTFIKGLYLYGQNRTGKTFLLSAIVNELALKNVKTVFVYVPDLIRDIHSSIDEGLLEEKVRQLKIADLLVLDDLGSAFMNRWFRDQVFGPVIQYRLGLGLPVLISSNLTIKQLSEYLMDPNIENDKYAAVRIITRINELTTQVKLSEQRY